MVKTIRPINLRIVAARDAGETFVTIAAREGITSDGAQVRYFRVKAKLGQAPVRPKSDHHDEIMPKVLALYAKNIGRKGIAKLIGERARVVWRVLKKSGVYQPGKLKGMSGQAAEDGTRTPTRFDQPPPWKVEMRKREERSRAKRTRRVGDLDLFAHGARSKRHAATKTPEGRAKSAADYRARYHGDLSFRLTEILRRRLNKVAQRGRGYGGNTLQWLGCTPLELREHLSSQWAEGMTWDNIGVGAGKWNIDHIRPCASYDMTDEQQRLACFHWSNMRPMWSLDNIRKGAHHEGVRHGRATGRKVNAHE